MYTRGASTDGRSYRIDKCRLHAGDFRYFPIQDESSQREPRKQHEPTSIPWWLAKIAHAEYVRQYGGQQTIEHMAERMGFGRTELLTLLRKARLDSAGMRLAKEEVDAD